MSPKMGRPIVGATPKSSQIGFRVSNETVVKFDACKRISGKTKVELFEEMVNNLYDRLTNGK